jgi:hypothetical protein
MAVYFHYFLKCTCLNKGMQSVKQKVVICQQAKQTSKMKQNTRNYARFCTVAPSLGLIAQSSGKIKLV